MKNRFYGDKKDYFKYGILDILSTQYKSIGINWYLTDDRDGNQLHGKDIRYLDDERWRRYNPRIYSLLKQRVENAERAIKYLKIDKVISFTHEIIEPLPRVADRMDYETQREDWHLKAIKELAKCDLVVFDPDTGVKEKLPDDTINASEYCTASELEKYNWCDWLVVQFLKRESRFSQLISNPVTKIARQRKKKITALITPQVSFLLVSNTISIPLLQEIFQTWDTKISTQILVS